VINTAIRLGDAVETAEELMNPEAQLPLAYQSAANLYQTELFSLQLQGGRVRRHVCNRTYSLGQCGACTVVKCHFMLETFCVLLVWLEPRGAECRCGNAVGCRGAERGAGHQRPPGCDRAAGRLSSGLHQHGARQPQQV